jgi:DNA-directed RNA polymerase subunit M/transcription elongation factor TFIIS
MKLRTIENPDKFRENVRDVINKKIDDVKASKNLEIGIFNFTLKEADQKNVYKKWDNEYFVLIYLDHLKSILVNLTENWIQEIKSGNIKSPALAFMTHQELNHEKWDAYIESKSKRDKNKFEFNMAASTDTFTCRKCKGNQCTYYLQQVRSADEPMTCYCTCLQCGHKWKTQ